VNDHTCPNQGRGCPDCTRATRAALFGLWLVLRRIPAWVWPLVTMWVGWALAGGV
jgi:hypothetical protein